MKNEIRILHFQTYPDGRIEGLFSYEKKVTLTVQKAESARPENVTIEDWTKRFIEKVRREIDSDCVEPIASTLEGSLLP